MVDYRRLHRYVDRYLGLPLGETRILDLGCGQKAGLTALFHIDGAKVTGTDIEIPTFRMDLPIFLKTLRVNGWERALESLSRHLLFDRRYFPEVSKQFGKGLVFDGIDIRIMDGTCLIFESEVFDFVYSRAVLEHVKDVDGAVREMNRVLKPSGIAIMIIHLFPSLSGGHNALWRDPDRPPRAVVPRGIIFGKTCVLINLTSHPSGCAWVNNPV